MPNRLPIPVALSLALICAVASAQPTTKPAEPQFVMTAMRVQQLKGPQTYVYCEAATTINDIHKTIESLMMPIHKAEQSGKLPARREVVFVYQGATGKVNEPFILQVGNTHDAEVNEAPAGCKVRQLQPLRAATAIFSGPISAFMQAYGKLFAEISAARLTPTQESREVYLYWEGPESPNNVVILQVGVK